MQIRTVELRRSLNKAIFIAGTILFAGFCVLVAKWAFGNVTAVRAGEPEVAELGLQLTPNDPQANFEVGSLLEKTLLAEDQTKALHHFETAAALSPNNYEYWLSLGRAREQAGETAGAENAFRKAADLAPNYSRVRWALGNALLRQGRHSEAFSEIRTAAAADRTFAAPAAALAFQIFGGDAAKISDAIGDSLPINVSLAVQFVNAKRFADAAGIWRGISAEDKRTVPADIATQLYSKLVEGGRYSAAIEVATETGLFTASDVAIGTISNGGFESALAADNAHAFAWTIADGAQPRIGLNESQKHSGSYSLLVSFGTRGTGSRAITQKVGVAGGAAYELKFHYRSELTTEGEFRCEVLPAGGGDPIASVALPRVPVWTEMIVNFTVPADAGGVDIRLSNRCSTASCTFSGNIWFDDFTISKR